MNGQLLPVPDAAGAPDAAPGAAPFDALAADYDARFTGSVLGGLLRRAVWRRLDAALGPGDRILDLGCGTGADAVHLGGRGVQVVAVDGSAAMVAAARTAVEAAGLGARVRVRRRPIEVLGALEDAPPFDAALSNFGALNLVADLGGVAGDLAGLVRPGGRAFLVLMGPVVPWEWAWYLARGAPATAFRRLRPGGAPWRGVRVRYPSPARLRRAFAGRGFRHRATAALGALLPPPFAEDWARRRPGAVRRLDALERRLETVFPLPWLADHYLVELERR